MYISISLRNILDIDELRQVQFNIFSNKNLSTLDMLLDYNTGDHNEIVLAGFETECK